MERAPAPEMLELLLEAERLPLATERAAPRAIETWESAVKARAPMVVAELTVAEEDLALAEAKTAVAAGPGGPAGGAPAGKADQLDWDQLELSWPTQ